MQIAVISDTHFGARGDRQALLDHQKKFYDEIFFPELEKRNIKTVWHLGDLVDRRKFINYKTLDIMREAFLEPLRKYDTHIIMGNHDMYYKNIVTPNAVDELLLSYPNITAYCYPTEVDNICVIPWICEETKSAAYKLLNKSKKQFCFGHLQIEKFEMDRGHYCDDGEDMKLFSQFDMVLTGHFHHRSSYNNITYVGATNEMTWRDYRDARGFNILDTETLKFEHIENKFKLFHKIKYDDLNKQGYDVFNELEENLENIKNGFVKVVVKNKTNNYIFDEFIDKLQEQGPSDLQIVDDHFNLNIETDDVILEQAEDTLTILSKYTDSMDLRCDRVALNRLLKELYDEAALLRS